MQLILVMTQLMSKETRKEENWYTMRRYDLSGGMETSTNPFLMSDAQFTYLKNVNHDEQGSLSKDGGYSNFRSATTGVDSDDLVFDYMNWSGVHTPIKIAGGNIYKAEVGGSEWTQIQASATSSGKRVSAVNYLDRMYFTTESDNVQYYDGTDIKNISTDNGDADVRGKYLAVLGPQLYVGNITTVHDASTVVSSGQGTHRFYNPTFENYDTYATTSQRFTVNGEITGMVGYQGVLLIFTQEAMWTYNPEVQASPKVVAETGCIAHDTIKEIDGTLYWTGRDGVYRFTGNSMPVLISLPITNWAVNSVWRLISGSNWTNMSAGVLDGKYYLWVGDLTSTLPGDSKVLKDVVVVYDTYRDSWSFYDNHPVRQWATVVDSNGNKRLIMANNSSGQTLIRDYSYTHSGSAIESIIRTKYFDFENPEAEKALNDMFVSYRPEAETDKYLTVSVAINGSNDYETYLDNASSRRLPLTGETTKEYQFERVSLNGLRARTASYEFKNNDEGVNVTLLGFSQEFMYKLPNMNYTT